MSLNFSSLILLILFAIALIGCISRSAQKISEYFSTEIMEDGSKRFYFSLIISHQHDEENNNQMREKQSKRGKGGSGRGSGTRKGGNDNAQTKQSTAKPAKSTKTNSMELELEERLINQLALNSYCRTGYMELERNIGRALMSIRGECHESATEGDRQRFILR